MAIIKSLLDQDLYKLTMMQAVLHNFPGAKVRYKFKCRNDADLVPLADQIEDELKELCKLRYTKEELEYLRTLKFLKDDFVDFLKLFQFDESYFNVAVNNNELDINIKGPWLYTIQFEVFALAIVQEVYTRNNYADLDTAVGKEKLDAKINEILQNDGSNKFTFADFGTRRRFSREWQEYVVATLCEKIPNTVFTGTSNIDLARRYNLHPIGTMAHEYLQAGQALGPRLCDSQKFMLESWVKEYRGMLGIALSDVVGFDAFKRDFDLYFAKLFDGCRHDSGDPFQWGEELIEHYEMLGINAKDKVAVFSDGLDVKKAIDLANRFNGRIKTSFGIGTNLTHDMGVKPLQVVMKMVECNDHPVAKISDSPGKGMCEDEEFLKYLKSVFLIKG